MPYQVWEEMHGFWITHDGIYKANLVNRRTVMIGDYVTTEAYDELRALFRTPHVILEAQIVDKKLMLGFWPLSYNIENMPILLAKINEVINGSRDSHPTPPRDETGHPFLNVEGYG